MRPFKHTDPAERLTAIGWSEAQWRTNRSNAALDFADADAAPWGVRSILRWLAARRVRRCDRELHKLNTLRRACRLELEDRLERHRAGRKAAHRKATSHGGD